MKQRVQVVATNFKRNLRSGGNVRACTQEGSTVANRYVVSHQRDLKTL